MIRIYKTSDTTFVLSEKTFKDPVPAIASSDSVDEAFDLIMDEHYIPSKGVTVRFDRDLEDTVYESNIPDVDEKSFIDVKRYLHQQ